MRQPVVSVELIRYYSGRRLPFKIPELVTLRTLRHSLLVTRNNVPTLRGGKHPSRFSPRPSVTLLGKEGTPSVLSRHLVSYPFYPNPNLGPRSYCIDTQEPLQGSQTKSITPLLSIKRSSTPCLLCHLKSQMLSKV